MGYGPPIDMWSTACILVELLTGRPIFPAKSENELILLITEILGLPSPSVLYKASRNAEFFPGGVLATRRDRKGRIRKPGTRSLTSICGSDDPDLIDFLASCLTWDPVERLTPAEALRHPFIVGSTPCSTPPRRLSIRNTERSPIGRVLAESVGCLGSATSLNDSGVPTSVESQEGGAMVCSPVITQTSLSNMMQVMQHDDGGTETTPQKAFHSAVPRRLRQLFA